MKLYYDLHIHTALSPCADNNMTPNNIINMAILKGLDIIAITDHNSTANLPPFFEINPKGLKVMPGIEVQTREEAHMLCYFKNPRNAMRFGTIIESHLPDTDCSSIFGDQLIYDRYDNITGNFDKLLLNSTDLSVTDVCKIAAETNGTVVPAHVDRPHYSLISNLGFVPENIHFTSAELADIKNETSYRKYFGKNIKFIFSSDAHTLGNINERAAYIDVNFTNINEIFNGLFGAL